MTLAEAIETTRIHRVAGLTGDRTPWVTTRPFRAPHHTISDAGLIGGGHVPMPGEVSLAHNGVLFLDEWPEFRRHVLEVVLRQPLVSLAHAAARTKGTYPAALYQRLAACRGRKRPIMAVAHAFVVIAFHMLSRHEPYCELGPSYLDKQRRDHFVDRLTRRMQRLGYRVHLEPVQTA
jgi:hypothetical protein